MTKIATIDTFTKGGRLVPRGALLDEDEIDFEEGKSSNVTDAPAGVEDAGAIEISAIAPTGPNPKNPQQLAPGVIQTQSGYFDRGQRLVGEVTVPEKERFVEIVDDESTIQGDVEEALAQHDQEQGAARTENDDVNEGTVADVRARVADADADELRRLRAAEEDREKPRKGVLDAIDARLEAL